MGSGGLEPASCQALQRAARDVDEEAVVWREDASLPPLATGHPSLGDTFRAPRLHPPCPREESDAHSRLFERIPAVGDLHAAWLLVSVIGCATLARTH